MSVGPRLAYLNSVGIMPNFVSTLNTSNSKKIKILGLSTFLRGSTFVLIVIVREDVYS